MKKESTNIRITIHGDWPKLSGEITSGDPELAQMAIKHILSNIPVTWVGSAFKTIRGQVVIPFRGDSSYGQFIRKPAVKK